MYTCLTKLKIFDWFEFSIPKAIALVSLVEVAAFVHCRTTTNVCTSVSSRRSG